MNFLRPNAAQTRWREQVRSLGSIASGMFGCPSDPIEIHHAAGRSASHNKIHVGHWWILPLLKSEHEQIPDLGHERKRWEKSMFGKVLVKLETRGTPIPFGRDVYQAIMEYRR